MNNIIGTLGRLLVIVLLFLALIVAQLFGLEGAQAAIQQAIIATFQA